MAIIRKVLEHYKIIIPKEIRTFLQINEGDAVRWKRDGDKIIVTKEADVNEE